MNKLIPKSTLLKTVTYSPHKIYLSKCVMLPRPVSLLHKEKIKIRERIVYKKEESSNFIPGLISGAILF